MTSGELLKYRKGLCIAGGYGTSVSVSSRFGLTLPDDKVLEVETVHIYSTKAKMHKRLIGYLPPSSTKGERYE